MKSQTIPTRGIPGRTLPGHCPVDPLNEACEKFFQIWSHKAANISNELIEYTIRRMQSDRLRFLFQTRHEFTQIETIEPICRISMHTEDDLQRIRERIRRFCLTTRNAYRHLRSDSRLYPDMAIDLDQGITIKICRFIFKTKVLVKIFSKEQHLSEQQREAKMSKRETKVDLTDPYKNITKAFIALQSNFEILFGDIVDRDFFQNAKTGRKRNRLCSSPVFDASGPSTSHHLGCQQNATVDILLAVQTEWTGTTSRSWNGSTTPFG